MNDNCHPSLRTADTFPVIDSLPLEIFFGGREVTTGNASAVRRLLLSPLPPCFLLHKYYNLLGRYPYSYMVKLCFSSLRAKQHYYCPVLKQEWQVASLVNVVLNC